jgi:hypothetical protein
MSSCSCVILIHGWHLCQFILLSVSQVFLLLVKGDYNYIIVPGLSSKASRLHSWQCPAIANFTVHRIVQLAEVLTETFWRSV